jgi:hypothetical protein
MPVNRKQMAPASFSVERIRAMFEVYADIVCNELDGQPSLVREVVAGRDAAKRGESDPARLRACALAALPLLQQRPCIESARRPSERGPCR